MCGLERLCYIKRKKQALVCFIFVLSCIIFMYFSDKTEFSKQIYHLSTPKPVPISRSSSSNGKGLNSQNKFKLVLPYIQPKLSTQEKDLYLAVIVNSGANGEKHRALRQGIRETWGNTSEVYKGTKSLKWRVFFAFGVAVTEADSAAALNEARNNNDVIIGNFTETYKNVVIKTFMGLFWSTNQLSVKSILKTDDDVYVRVPHLMTWLENVGSPRSFYGGYISKYHLIPRDPKSPWFISYKQYAKKNWPPWCHGAYTVFSSDVIPRYLIYTYRREPFHTDDAYFGVASEDLHIKAVHIPRFEIEHYRHPERVRSNAELNRTLTIGHNITPKQMLYFHSYYKNISS